MNISFVNETTMVVMLFIVVSVPFLLLIVVNNTTGFNKANKLLVKLKLKNNIYVQLRNMLRKKLIPLGFTEEETAKFGNEVKYVRNGLLVELYFDLRERQYSFFASNGIQETKIPPRQVAIRHFSAEEIDEKITEIVDALDEWLKSIE